MQSKPPNFVFATKNQRMLHFIIDTIFVKVVTLLIIQIIDVVFFVDEFGLAYFIDNLSRSETYLLYAPIMFVYFTFCELVWQKSFAKVFTNTKVVNQYGEKPTTIQILTRSLIRILPFESLTFLFDSNGWHDLYSETVVADVEKLNSFFYEKHQTI